MTKHSRFLLRLSLITPTKVVESDTRKLIPSFKQVPDFSLVSVSNDYISTNRYANCNNGSCLALSANAMWEIL